MEVAVEVQNRGKTCRWSSKSFLACSPHHPLELIPDLGQNPISDRATSRWLCISFMLPQGLRCYYRPSRRDQRELDKKGSHKAFSTSSSLVLT